MSCAICGKCGCVCGTLPYTMTVSFSGIGNQSANCDLAFWSNFGSGAAGLATSPGGCGKNDPACAVATEACNPISYGDDNKGPLSAVLLTDGGSCYAKVGRVAPTLKASCPGNGQGADFTVTLEECRDCNEGRVHYWRVPTISVSGGTGYADGEEVKITHSVGDSVRVTAGGLIHTKTDRTGPTLNLNAIGGVGAQLTPTVKATGWGVTTVSLDNGGGSGVAYGTGLDYQKLAAGTVGLVLTKVRAKTRLEQPTLKFRSSPGPTVGYADYDGVLVGKKYDDDRDYWQVSSLSVKSPAPGGHYVGESVEAILVDGNGNQIEQDRPPDQADMCAAISAVDSNGVPTKVDVYYGGSFALNTGEVVSVDVLEPGCYYDTGDPPTKPTLDFILAGGISPPLTLNVSPTRWGVVSCKVAEGGSGYTDGCPVVVSSPDAHLLTTVPFVGKALTEMVPPAVSLEVKSDHGSDAVLSAEFEDSKCFDGRPCWEVSSINVDNAGNGYFVGDPISLTVTAGVEKDNSCFRASVEKIDNKTGAIISVEVKCGGLFRLDTGVIESVEISEVGRYCIYTGEPEGVIAYGSLAAFDSPYTGTRGEYFREDKTAAPYVADVTVGACSWQSTQDSGGSGAVISATVDSAASSAKFGQISALAIDSGGDGYLAWHRVGTCNDKLPSEFVLRADDPEPLVSLCVKTCFGSGAIVVGDPRPSVESDSFCQCSTRDDYLSFDHDGAKLPGRTAPTVRVEAAAGSTGDGAEFTATLGQRTDDCGVSYWTVESVSVDGGKCYGHFARTMPVVVASPAAGGTGAAFNVVFEEIADDECGQSAWKISGVTVDGWYGSSGYSDGDEIVFSALDGTIQELLAKATLVAEQYGECDPDTSSGLVDLTNCHYGAKSVTVTDGGKYYRQSISSSEPLVALCDDTEISRASLTLNVDQSTGVPVSVKVNTGGIYYREDGKSLSQSSCRNCQDYSGSPSAFHGIGLAAGGDGYAVFGREKPTITVSQSGDSTGDGASFTVTLAKVADSCDIPQWEIESVSVSGGTCYAVDGRKEPSLSATTARGDGALFDVKLNKITDKCGGDAWEVSEILPFGGCGYFDGDAVQIVSSSEVFVAEEAEATLTAVDGCGPGSVEVSKGGKYYIPGPMTEPLEAQAQDILDQHGKASLLLHADETGVPVGVTVVSPGIYYKENASLPPYVASKCFARVEPSVGITKPECDLSFKAHWAQVERDCGRVYWEIESVSVTGESSCQGGALRVMPMTDDDVQKKLAVLLLNVDENGNPDVSVVDGGLYFREDTSSTIDDPCAGIKIDQAAGSTGSGAKFSFGIDEDTNSNTFGSLNKVTLVSGGSDYTFFGQSRTCTYKGGCNDTSCHGYEGVTLRFSDGGLKPRVEFTYGGPTAVFESGGVFEDCRGNPPWATTTLHGPGGTATIERGGVWQTGGTRCCSEERCTQYYTRDPIYAPDGCKSEPFDTVVFSTDYSTCTYTDLIPNNSDINASGFVCSNADFAPILSGPYNFRSYYTDGFLDLQLTVYAELSLVSAPAVLNECGCGTCAYDVGVRVFSYDNYSQDDPYYNERFGGTIKIDRCNEESGEVSISIPGCAIKAAVDPVYSLGRSVEVDKVCPDGFSSGGPQGCQREEEAIGDLFCDYNGDMDVNGMCAGLLRGETVLDPFAGCFSCELTVCPDDERYGAAADYCASIGGVFNADENGCGVCAGSHDFFRTEPCVALGGTPKEINCYHCKYYIHFDASEGCPDGSALGDDGKCYTHGIVWNDTDTFDSASVSASVSGKVDCDNNCQCHGNPLP